MAVPAYATPAERVWYYLLRLICAAVLLFLISPILAIMPLSFNSVPFFTYPMPGLSLQWYEDFFLTDRWQGALRTRSSSPPAPRCWRRSWAPWPRSASAARISPSARRS